MLTKENSSSMIYASTKNVATKKKVAAKKKTAASNKKKTGVKKAAVKKVASKKSVAVKTVGESVDKKNKVPAAPQKNGGVSKNGAQIDAEQHRKMIAVAAYYIAERRHFSEGDESEDWYQAEREIEGLLEANMVS